MFFDFFELHVQAQSAEYKYGKTSCLSDRPKHTTKVNFTDIVMIVFVLVKPPILTRLSVCTINKSGRLW